MKYTVLIVLILLTQLVSAQNQSGTVRLLSATTQEWITGASPGKTGTTFTLKVKILSAKPVTFKNLWMGKEHVDFDVQTFFTDPNKKPVKGDSVLLVFTRMDKKPEETKTEVPLPTQYKGKALLQYYMAHRPRYLVVEKFEKLRIIKGE